MPQFRSRDEAIGYLSAMVDGEGSIRFRLRGNRVNRYITIPNTNPDLIQAVQAALNLLGIEYGTYTSYGRSRMENGYKRIYRVEIYGHGQLRQFLAAVPVYALHKLDNLIKSVSYVLDPYVEEALLHQWYVADGLSATQIGRRLRCSRTPVIKLLRQYGIDVREHGTARRLARRAPYRSPSPGVEILHHLYHENRWSAGRIATHFNVSIKLAMRWLNESGLPLRDLSQTARLRCKADSISKRGYHTLRQRFKQPGYQPSTKNLAIAPDYLAVGNREFACGYLGGMIDGEGNIAFALQGNKVKRQITIGNTDDGILDAISRSYDIIEVPYSRYPRPQIQDNWKPVTIIDVYRRDRLAIIDQCVPIFADYKKKHLRLGIDYKIPSFVEREQLEALYINQRLSVPQVAFMLDVSETAVRKKLVEFDIPIRSVSESVRAAGFRRGINVPAREELYDLYVVQQYSMERLAKQYQVSRDTVDRWLVLLKIPKRTRHEAYQARGRFTNSKIERFKELRKVFAAPDNQPVRIRKKRVEKCNDDQKQSELAVHGSTLKTQSATPAPAVTTMTSASTPSPRQLDLFGVNIGEN